MKNINIGVVNPYALGEIVAGKKIRWNSITNPKKRLSQILDIPENVIFNSKNPILSPDRLLKYDEIEPLEKEEARERTYKFFEENTLKKDTAFKMGNLYIPPFESDYIPNLINDSILSITPENDRPWQPEKKVWADKGDYFEDIDEFSDPIQGFLGDCYLIAAMASVALSRDYAIANMVRPSDWDDDNNPIHRISFYRNGTGAKENIEITEKVPVTESGKQWFYAHSNDSKEIWPAVMEKAYAKWKTENTTDSPPYSPIAGGDPIATSAEIIGGECEYRKCEEETGDSIWKFIRSNCRGGTLTFNPMTAATYYVEPDGRNYETANVVASHAYSVLGTMYRNGEKYIVLRNPWGTHHATLDTLSGWWPSAIINSEWQWVPLNSNGVFAMHADTFQYYYKWIGVAY